MSNICAKTDNKVTDLLSLRRKFHPKKVINTIISLL
jgi:hypothetical protein